MKSLSSPAWAATIETHYGKPMDMEWAKDGETGRLYIVQARPETVQSRSGCRAAIRSYKRQRAREGRSSRASPSATRQSSGRVCLIEHAQGHRPLRGGLDPRHRDDRPRLGADHEEGGGHRHRPRRAHLARRHRQPRARPARHRRHRRSDAASARRAGGDGRLRGGEDGRRLRRSRADSRSRRWTSATCPRRRPGDDEHRQPGGRVPVVAAAGGRASASPAWSSSSTTAVRIHPMALVRYDTLKDEARRRKSARSRQATRTSRSTSSTRSPAASPASRRSHYPQPGHRPDERLQDERVRRTSSAGTSSSRRRRTR